jgi:hypothetical protein
MARIARTLCRLLPRKPKNWFPHLSLLLVPLALNYLATLWLPSTAGTASFPTAVALTRALTLAPLILPAIAPTSWGTVHADPHDGYRGITRLFNLISVASALLHAKTTVSALLYNLPDSHRHRHSIKLPFDTEKRSKWERTATAVEHVLGSLTDHPAVAAAGRDALLCALSLGLWAAVRGTDVGGMLRAMWPFSTSESEGASDEGVAKTEPSAHDEGEGATNAAVPPLSMTLRRRGGRASKKTSVSSIASADMPAPFEESTHTPPTPPRRRGRPRKVKPEPEPEPEQDDGLEPEEVPDDKTYVPTPAVKASAGLGDVLPEDDFDWEPASLAWGLTALAGLGVGSAAVFGAECVSR